MPRLISWCINCEWEGVLTKGWRAGLFCWHWPLPNAAHVDYHLWASVGWNVPELCRSKATLKLAVSKINFLINGWWEIKIVGEKEGRERKRKRMDGEGGGGDWERESEKKEFFTTFMSYTCHEWMILQPENILLYRKGSLDIKIADFGLSVQVRKGQEMKTLVGTAEYVCKSQYPYTVVTVTNLYVVVTNTA